MDKKCIEFARHCMIKLVSVTTKGSDIPEISSENLNKINKILREFSKGNVSLIDANVNERKYYSNNTIGDERIKINYVKSSS